MIRKKSNGLHAAESLLTTPKSLLCSKDCRFIYGTNIQSNITQLKPISNLVSHIQESTLKSVTSLQQLLDLRSYLYTFYIPQVKFCKSLSFGKYVTIWSHLKGDLRMVSSCIITIRCKFTFDCTSYLQMDKCSLPLTKQNYLDKNFTKKKFIFIYIV